jgi:hypothetical protein
MMGSRRDWRELERIVDTAKKSVKDSRKFQPRSSTQDIEIPEEFMTMPLSELGQELQKFRKWGLKRDGTPKLIAYGRPERLKQLLAMDKAFKLRKRIELD